MFAVGDTVLNKFNGETATITDILDGGMIRVRFDGETVVNTLHHTRFKLCEVAVNAPASGPNPKTFKRGDYVQVTDSDGNVVHGAALHTHGSAGYATFDVLTDDGMVLSFNSNFHKFLVIFRADIARGEDPKY